MTDLYKHFYSCPISPYRGGSPSPPNNDSTWPHPPPSSGDMTLASTPTVSSRNLPLPSSSLAPPVAESRSLLSPDRMRSSRPQPHFPDFRDDFLIYEDAVRVRVHMDADSMSENPFVPCDDLTPRASDYPPFFQLETPPREPCLSQDSSGATPEGTTVVQHPLASFPASSAGSASSAFVLNPSMGPTPIATHYRPSSESAQVDTSEGLSTGRDPSRDYEMMVFLESERLGRDATSTRDRGVMHSDGEQVSEALVRSHVFIPLLTKWFWAVFRDWSRQFSSE